MFYMSWILGVYKSIVIYNFEIVFLYSVNLTKSRSAQAYFGFLHIHLMGKF